MWNVPTCKSPSRSNLVGSQSHRGAVFPQICNFPNEVKFKIPSLNRTFCYSLLLFPLSRLNAQVSFKYSIFGSCEQRNIIITQEFDRLLHCETLLLFRRECLLLVSRNKFETRDTTLRRWMNERDEERLNEKIWSLSCGALRVIGPTASPSLSHSLSQRTLIRGIVVGLLSKKHAAPRNTYSSPRKIKKKERKRKLPKRKYRASPVRKAQNTRRNTVESTCAKRR